MTRLQPTGLANADVSESNADVSESNGDQHDDSASVITSSSPSLSNSDGYSDPPLHSEIDSESEFQIEASGCTVVINYSYH